MATLPQNTVVRANGGLACPRRISHKPCAPRVTWPASLRAARGRHRCAATLIDVAAGTPAWAGQAHLAPARRWHRQAEWIETVRGRCGPPSAAGPDQPDTVPHPSGRLRHHPDPCLPGIGRSRTGRSEARGQPHTGSTAKTSRCQKRAGNDYLNSSVDPGKEHCSMWRSR